MILSFLFFLAIDHSIGAKINFAYDDNIFEYSKKYLNEFINNINPERFPFETYDDIYTHYEFQLLMRKKFIGQYTTTFNFIFNGYNYLINQQKDYFFITTGARQSFGKWATKIEYLYLPHYLIRYYQNPDSAQYTGCEFSENLFSIKTDFRLTQKGEFGLLLRYEIDDYIENFNIYDAKALRSGLHIDFAISRRFETKIAYEFKSSRARGPIPDVSYEQHLINLKNYINIGFPRLSELTLAYQFKYRIYTTEVSPIIDSPHSGRNDITQRFNLRLAFPVLPALYVNSEYIYELRQAHSDVYPEIGDYKNYNKWTFKGGLEFEY